MRKAVVITALLSGSLALGAGCKSEKPTKPKTEEVKSNGNPEARSKVKPVYPTEVGEVSPLVKRFCETLHALPKNRKAECCKRKPGVIITSECIRNLTGALNDKAVTLDEAGVTACETAMEKHFEGCDWVGPWTRSLPVVCTQILKGKKSAGDVCRSSLECGDGLRCHGVGPTDVGRCGKPYPAGSLCGTGVDTLAVFTRQDNYEKTKPACEAGYCDRTRCRPKVEVGAACRSSVQCKVGRCAKGKCVEAPLGGENEACTGADCAPGLRCNQNICIKPKGPGEKCERDDECMAACQKAPGEKTGVCQMRCSLPPVLERLQNRKKMPKRSPK